LGFRDVFALSTVVRLEVDETNDTAVLLRDEINATVDQHIPQQLSEMEQQLEDMTPWMSGVFTYGQPSFADDPLEPLYLDDDGNLSSLDNVVPAPRLELGTP